jgi:hypothetical protein
MSNKIQATVLSKIGFASHQNSVPVVRELEVIQEGGEPGEDLILELTADPGFLEPKRWLIDRLEPDSPLHIRDRDVKLQAGFLADLTESITGERSGSACSNRTTKECMAPACPTSNAPAVQRV